MEDKFSTGKYEGNKWGGKYLRAPDIFFTILEKGKDKFIELEDIAEVKPGCYSGINDFFYLSRKEIADFNIEPDYLLPIIRTSRQVEASLFNVRSNDNYVLSCHLGKKDLRKLGHLGILRYIEWGEKQVTRQRQKTAKGIPWPQTETVKRRKPSWWSIPKENLRMTQLFMLYVINDRFLFPFSNAPICSDRCFHRLFLENSSTEDYKCLAAILNCTLTLFLISLMGRAGLGQGALKYETKDAKNLLVINPRSLSKKEREAIIGAFDGFSRRQVRNIFEETSIDLRYPVREQKPNPLPDRKALDDIVFDILCLTEDERNEVYWAVCELVKNRLEKARSV